jgi:O-antigen ligase
VVPFGIGTGSESELNPPLLLIIVLLGIWLLDAVRRHDIRLIPSRTTLPLIAFLVATLLAFGFGQLPWFFANAAPIRAQIGGLAIFVLSVCAFLLTCHYVKDLRWLEWLTWIFLALGGLYIVGLIVPPIGGLTTKLYLQNAVGSLFWTWLVALAFSQAAFNRQMRPFARILLGVLVLATLVFSMTRNRAWTSGWAPPLVAIIVILLAASPRLGIVAVSAGVVLAVLMPQTFSGLIDVGDNSYSAMTRVEAWEVLFQIIKVSPILGLGFANYYWFTPLFSILGYHVRFNSHNNYVDLVAQTGLLGLACFLWFSVEVGRLGWQLRERVPSGFAQAYVYGALGGLAGTLFAGMLGDWVLPFVYNVGFGGFRASVLGWLFMGGLVALEQMTTGQIPNVRSTISRFVPIVRS